MSIDRVIEIPEGRSAEKNHEFVVTARRRFMAYADSGTAGPKEVLDGLEGVGPATVPSVGQTYSGDDTLFCVKVSVDAASADSPRLWMVTAEYTTQVTQMFAIGGTGNENPLLRPPEISGGFVRRQNILDVDKVTGLVPKNANDEYEEVIVDDDGNTLVYTRNEANYPLAAQNFYRNAVNSDAFLGVAPKVAKMMGISATSAYENGRAYYRVTYEIEFNLDTWVIKIPHRGTKYRTTAGGAIIPTQRGEIVELDADGVKVAAGGQLYDSQYNGYYLRPFAPLGITI